jgi:addiction module RelE/StbE family toxin
MLRILYRPVFIRQYWKLSESLREEVNEKIKLFQKDPTHSFLKIHKLKGKLAGCLSFSVNYQYRVIFEFVGKDAIRLFAVGKHEIYG